MSSYHEVLNKDLELLWSIQEYCYRTPWLNELMSRIISKHPHKDIVIILYIFFIIGILEIGVKHFWIVMINLVLSFTLNKLIESKRPIEYDIRLQPLTDKNPERYGFPSLESYMSVVIMLHLFLSFKSVLLLPLSLFIIFIIGFSRVYSRSRFPHQIVGSWLLGFIGLITIMNCCDRIGFHKMKAFDHGVCVAIVTLGLIANFALNVENNDSRLAYIPKEEFIRVMADIVSGGSKPESANAIVASSIFDVNEEDDDMIADMTKTVPGSTMKSPYDISSGGRGGSGGSMARSSGNTTESPRTTALRLAQSSTGAIAAEGGKSGNLKQRRIKSDSLFFLQRSMELREERYKKGQQPD